MNSQHSTALSVFYIGWINEQLRSEVERRAAERRQAMLTTRLKGVATAVISVLISFTAELWE